MEKPILFSAPMINAILNGQKTMTRRVIKPQPDDGPWPDAASHIEWHDFLTDTDYYVACGHCPYGKVGDALWVRETFAVNCIGGEDFVFYRADSCPDGDGAKWKPSIFMPRKYSRITLRITSVRAERLQDISEEGANAEGVWAMYQPHEYADDKKAVTRFRWLWDSINGQRGYGWDANPWVWVITFDRI